VAQKQPPSEFALAVYRVVEAIPAGRVSTYGQIARLIGSPRAAQQVGWVLHWSPKGLPAYKVVNRFGGLAGGYTDGGRDLHRADLESHGYEVSADYTVDLSKYLWEPTETEQWSLRAGS
jgi:methylated-DNA-protein-cysteine methyltransferase-like protein